MEEKRTAGDARNDNLGLPDGSLKAIREALRDLEFGSVTLVVQDGLIVQVDRLEKKRLVRSGNRS